MALGDFKKTVAIDKLLKMRARIKGVPGSSSAAKTFGILAILISRACKYPGRKISVVSESIPHLERGAIQDYKTILQDTLRWNLQSWNDSKKKSTWPNGSWIEFFSVEDPGKVHGPRRDELYINEGNRIKFETFHHLNIRTNASIWIDFNPSRKFWYHTEIVGDPDWEELVLTYKDNITRDGVSVLNPAIVRELEKMGEKGFFDKDGDVYDELNIKNDYWANQYRVYGLGLLGTLEGQIFKHFKHVAALPEGKCVYGLDFGYEHDPTALVQVVKWKGEIYARELYYETGYRSKSMIEFLYLHGVGPNDPIICDHDKTAVRDLRDHGFLAFYADKHKGSVKSGIQAIQDIKVNITHDSPNFIFEEENYYWQMQDGKPTGEPVDANNHLCDGLRYSLDYIINPTKPHFMKQWKDRRGGRRRLY